MLTNILEIQDYAETLVAAANIQSEGKKRFSVRYEDNVCPHTKLEGKDNVIIVLPTYDSSFSYDDMIRHKHHVIHEIMHHTEGADAWKVWVKENIPKNHEDPLANICNATEDYRIERKASDHYFGDKLVISEGTNIDMGLFIPKLTNKTLMNRIAESESDAAYVAVSIADYLERCNHNHFPNEREFMEAVQKLPKKIKDNLDKLKSIDYGRKLHEAETAKDSTALGKEAFKTLFNKDPEQHCKEQNPNGQQGKGQGQGGKEGKGQGQGTDDTGEGEGGKVADAIEDNSKIVGKLVHYKEMMEKPHDGPALGTGNNLDYSQYKPGSPFTPTPKNQIRLHDFVKDPAITPRYQYNVVKSEIEKANSLSRPFANKVRRLIQVKADAHYIGNMTRGKINRKAVYRVGVEQVGNGEWNSRVFKQKRADDVLDTVIQLLIDGSGSMNNEKYFQAVVGAAMLNEAFDRTLHIPVEILGFSETGRRTHMGIIKTFDKHFNYDQLDKNARAFAAIAMGCNSDGEAILFGYQRIIKMPQRRKIMIVLSDGSPASNRGDAVQFTKKVIREIETGKKVDLCAIGIQHQGVRDLYKEFQIVKRVEELPNAIIGLLKNKLVHK